jgi:hypothetical protein
MMWACVFARNVSSGNLENGCEFLHIMRISMNHNSLGCEQPLGLDVEQLPV